MINPTKHSYFYHKKNRIEDNDTIEPIEDIYTIFHTLKEHMTDATILQIKGHGSKISDQNWELFLNTPTFEPTKTNAHRFNQFNYKVFEWCKTNINEIHTNKVVVQYDGDKLLENNYENSDTLLQNYTGMIYGLVYYLLSFNKEVHLLCMLDKPENKWKKNIDYHWKNGLKQINQLGVNVHFWIYDLLSICDKQTNILQNTFNIKKNDTEYLDRWGYKGCWNIVYLTTFNCKDHRILYFGVGNVVIDELIYLKHLDPVIFQRIKNHMCFYTLTRMHSFKDKTICYKLIPNIEYIKQLLNN